MRLRTLAGDRLARARGALFFCVIVAGCSDDPPFLSISSLCRTRAEDVCAARAGCCPSEDEAACRLREAAACEPVQRALEAEPLRYDSVVAARARGSERAALESCGTGVPPLVSYFSGALELYAACDRDAQCASGRCAGEPRTCVAAAARALCSDP